MSIHYQRYRTLRSRLLSCICLSAVLLLTGTVLSAQDAATIIPENKTTKDTSAQRDLIDIGKKILRIRINNAREIQGRKVYFSLLPFSSVVPGGSGKALITSTTAGAYLGPRKTTNISSASFTPYWNFNGRFGLPLRTSIWLPNNTWTIQGDTRFLYYPQYTWGLGTSRTDEERILVDYKYLRFYQSLLKRVTPYFYAGIGYQLDYRFNIKSDDSSINLKRYTGYAYGTGSNSFASGFSLNVLYDTRNNSINPLPGAYANVVYRNNPQLLGSNENWESLYIDVRKYLSLNPSDPDQQNVLAFWAYVWTSIKTGTPYLDLPSLGWDPENRSGRGIDQNRYRGESLFYTEAEYRRDITRNGLLGFVVFANINTVSGSGSFFQSWHPAGGAGLRIKFNKGSNTNIGMDYGFSKGYSSLMFSLGEAF